MYKYLCNNDVEVPRRLAFSSMSKGSSHYDAIIAPTLQIVFRHRHSLKRTGST